MELSRWNLKGCKFTLFKTFPLSSPSQFREHPTTYHDRRHFFREPITSRGKESEVKHVMWDLSMCFYDSLHVFFVFLLLHLIAFYRSFVQLWPWMKIWRNKSSSLEHIARLTIACTYISNSIKLAFGHWIFGQTELTAMICLGDCLAISFQCASAQCPRHWIRYICVQPHVRYYAYNTNLYLVAILRLRIVE